MKSNKIIIQFGKIVRCIDPNSETFNKRDGILVNSLTHGEWEICIKGGSLIVSGPTEKSFILEDGILYLCESELGSSFCYFRSRDLILLFERFRIYKYIKRSPKNHYAYRAGTNVNVYTDGDVTRKDLKNTIIYNITNHTFALEELVEEDGSITRSLTTREDPLTLEHLFNSLIDKR